MPVPAEATIKKKRRRRKKGAKQSTVPFYAAIPIELLKKEKEAEAEKEKVEIQYVVENDADAVNPEYQEYAEILNKFNPFAAEKVEGGEDTQESEEKGEKEEKEDKDQKSVSKKQKKKEKRDKIEVLKLLSDRPDVVEIHDVNSTYPWLLVDLKAYRNTIPVPRHWSQRRKYLQGKRGIEKPPFELPEFIRKTGIAELRQAVIEKEETQKLKQTARDRMQPKMGKIDIDYRVLYEAFFNYQTKPRLTGSGDLYYEGKEYEVDLKERKPGHLSKELRAALGMPEEGIFPPPWLTNMQRYGPPPSYPHLKIPGLNAPLPPGAKPGFHPGGWGHPPVDEHGRPLYGDWEQTAPLPADLCEPIEREPWGALEDVDEDEEEQPDAMQYQLADSSPEETPAPVPTVTNPIDPFAAAHYDPEAINLRKDTKPKQLFQELAQQDASVGSAIYGSQHRYVVPGERVDLIRSQRSEKMDVSLDPNDMEGEGGITEDLIRKKYEEKLQLDKEAHKSEDLSDLVIENAKRKQQKNSKKKEKFRF